MTVKIIDHKGKVYVSDDVNTIIDYINLWMKVMDYDSIITTGISKTKDEISKNLSKLNDFMKENAKSEDNKEDKQEPVEQHVLVEDFAPVEPVEDEIDSYEEGYEDGLDDGDIITSKTIMIDHMDHCTINLYL